MVEKKEPHPLGPVESLLEHPPSEMEIRREEAKKYRCESWAATLTEDRLLIFFLYSFKEWTLGEIATALKVSDEEAGHWSEADWFVTAWDKWVKWRLRRGITTKLRDIEKDKDALATLLKSQGFMSAGGGGIGDDMKVSDKDSYLRELDEEREGRKSAG